MNIILLDKQQHDRQRFDCKNQVLNQYLNQIASQQAQKDNARTYVLIDPINPVWIMGFYTLTMTSLDLSSLPQSLQKKHASVHSAGLIARLAVDHRYQKQGLGAILLLDALHRLYQASAIVAFPLVLVDAKDGIAEFYQQYGFQALSQYPNKLFMTMKDIAHNIST